jgi:hypothetical protein
MDFELFVEILMLARSVHRRSKRKKGGKRYVRIHPGTVFPCPFVSQAGNSGQA